MKKIAIGVVVAVVVVGVGLIAALPTMVNGKLQAAIVDGGTEYLGVPTTVESVSVSLLSGEGEVRGLAIANPDGFGAEPAMAVESIAFALDVASLFGDQPDIAFIRINGPQIAVQAEGLRLNWKEIYGNTQAAGDAEPKAMETEDSSEKACTIGEFKLADGSIRLSGLPGGADKQLDCPEIVLTDLGEGGTAGCVRQIVAAVRDVAVAKVAASKRPELLEALPEIELPIGGAGPPKHLPSFP